MARKSDGTVYDDLVRRAKAADLKFNPELLAGETVAKHLKRLARSLNKMSDEELEAWPEKDPGAVWYQKVADAIDAGDDITKLTPPGYPAAYITGDSAPAPKRTGAEALAAHNAKKRAEKEAREKAEEPAPATTKGKGKGKKAAEPAATGEEPEQPKRGRGRPKGSGNKPSNGSDEPKEPKQRKARTPKDDGAMFAVYKTILENPGASADDIYAKLEKQQVPTQRTTVLVAQSNTARLIRIARQLNLWRGA